MVRPPASETKHTRERSAPEKGRASGKKGDAPGRGVRAGRKKGRPQPPGGGIEQSGACPGGGEGEGQGEGRDAAKREGTAAIGLPEEAPRPDRSGRESEG